MKKTIMIVIIGFIFTSNVYASESNTKLKPMFNATLWGGGIGMVVGLAVSVLSTNSNDSETETWVKTRNRIVRGTGLGILFGLVYGIIEVNTLTYKTVINYKLCDCFKNELILTYNYKF